MRNINISNAIKNKWKDGDYRVRQLSGVKKFVAENRIGVKLTKEHRDNISKSCKGIAGRKKGFKQSEETKEKLRQIQLANLQDPAFRSRLFRRRKITGLEQKIIDLIKEFGLPYRFVGNGEVWIGRFNPDFIRTDKDKILIEVYWSFHKIRQYGSVKEYEQFRGQYFFERGYATIFLNERDFVGSGWKQRCFIKIREVTSG